MSRKEKAFLQLKQFSLGNTSVQRSESPKGTLERLVETGRTSYLSESPRSGPFPSLWLRHSRTLSKGPVHACSLVSALTPTARPGAEGTFSWESWGAKGTVTGTEGLTTENERQAQPSPDLPNNPVGKAPLGWEAWARGQGH